MERISVNPSNVRGAGLINSPPYSADLIKGRAGVDRTTGTVDGESVYIYTMAVATDTYLVLSLGDAAVSIQGKLWFPFIDEEGFRVNYSLTDENSQGISSQFVYDVDGTSSSGTGAVAINNGSGYANFFMIEDGQEFTIQSQFLGDNTTSPILNSCFSNVLNVKVGGVTMSLAASKSSVEYDEKFNLACTVRDWNNQLVPAGVSVEFYNENDTCVATATTGSDGVARLNNSFSRVPGTHAYYCKIGDTVSDSVNVTVKTPTITLRGGDSSQTVTSGFTGQRIPFYIELKDTQNNGIANSPVKVIFNGNTNAIGYTNSNGVLTGNTSRATAGSTTVVALANGNSSISSDTITLTYTDPIATEIVAYPSAPQPGVGDTVDFIAEVTATNSIGSVPVANQSVGFYRTGINLYTNTELINVDNEDTVVLNATVLNDEGIAVKNTNVGVYCNNELLDTVQTNNQGEITYEDAPETTGDYQYQIKYTKDNTVFSSNIIYVSAVDSDVKTEHIEIVFTGDSDNEHGNRPDKITGYITVSGMEVQSFQVKASENWSKSIIMPAHTGGGSSINYSITVNAVTDYGTPSITKSSDTGDNFTVTYAYDPPSSVTEVVKIVWDDDDTSSRPASVPMELNYNHYIATLTSSAEWQGAITGLPAKINRETMVYDWTPGQVEGYTIPNKSKTGNITTYTYKKWTYGE